MGQLREFFQSIRDHKCFKKAITSEFSTPIKYECSCGKEWIIEKEHFSKCDERDNILLSLIKTKEGNNEIIKMINI